MSSKQIKEIVDAMFLADENNDGNLTVEEITKFLESDGSVKKEQIDDFIKAVDKDGDHKVSREELTSILEKALNC